MKLAFIGTKGMNFGNTAFGGFETVVTELGPRLVNAGHQVTIYCRKKLYLTNRYPNKIRGVILKFLPSIESKNLGTMTNSFLSIVDAIRNKADVIYFFNLGLGIYLPFVKIFGIKTITNLDGVEWERGKWSNVAKMVFKTGAKLNIRYANYIIADSEEIRKIYLKKFNKDSVFIPYGAEIRNDLNCEQIKKFALKPNAYFLLTTRFIPENNPLFIIKNFLNTKTEKKLVVLGKNYYTSSYENRIKNIKDTRILFLGHIADRKLLYEFYHYSYSYIHGHSVGGTNPTMLEALANSCCILALDTKFNREMLENGKYGIFFKLNDKDFIEKIDYIDKSHQIVEGFKYRSKNRILKYYNWETVTKKYISLLKVTENKNC